MNLDQEKSAMTSPEFCLEQIQKTYDLIKNNNNSDLTFNDQIHTATLSLNHLLSTKSEHLLTNNQIVKTLIFNAIISFLEASSNFKLKLDLFLLTDSIISTDIHLEDVQFRNESTRSEYDHFLKQLVSPMYDLILVHKEELNMTEKCEFNRFLRVFIAMLICGSTFVLEIKKFKEMYTYFLEFPHLDLISKAHLSLGTTVYFYNFFDQINSPELLSKNMNTDLRNEVLNKSYVSALSLLKSEITNQVNCLVSTDSESSSELKIYFQKVFHLFSTRIQVLNSYFFTHLNSNSIRTKNDVYAWLQILIDSQYDMFMYANDMLTQVITN